MTGAIHNAEPHGSMPSWVPLVVCGATGEKPCPRSVGGIFKGGDPFKVFGAVVCFDTVKVIDIFAGIASAWDERICDEPVDRKLLLLRASNPDSDVGIPHLDAPRDYAPRKRMFAIGGASYAAPIRDLVWESIDRSPALCDTLVVSHGEPPCPSRGASGLEAPTVRPTVSVGALPWVESYFTMVTTW